MSLLGDSVTHTPKSSTGLLCMPAVVLKERLVFEWKNRIDFPVTLTDNFKVDEQPIRGAIEICEQPTVFVCSVAVEAEVYRFTEQEVPDECRGCFAKRLNGFLRVDCFGCIDTDERDACELAIVSDLHGIAVDDSRYLVSSVPKEEFGGISHHGCRATRAGIDTRCRSVCAKAGSGSVSAVVVVILACFSVVMPAVGICASRVRLC